jgi:type II secretory pathway component GspD/PulD (secretin)
MLSNLREFNYPQKQYTMQGIKNPSLKASKQTAKSSIQLHGPSRGRDDPENPQSGIHLSRTISKQARFIVNNNLLLDIKRQNQSNHKSLIDNLDVCQALFTWSASQTPVKVSFLYFD